MVVSIDFTEHRKNRIGYGRSANQIYLICLRFELLGKELEGVVCSSSWGSK